MVQITDPELLKELESSSSNTTVGAPAGDNSQGGIIDGIGIGLEGFGNTMQAVGQGMEESHLDKLQSLENPEDQKYIDAYTEETKSKSRYALKKEFAAQEAKAANLSTSGQLASGAVELGANLAPMALALNPVTAPLAIPVMSSLAGAQAYGRIAQDDIKQDRDIDQAKALTSAATDLVWNAAVGKYIPKGLGTATAKRRVVGEALGSGVGEVGSEGIYNLATGREFTENMGSAFIGGSLIGGGIKGAGEGFSKLKDVDWSQEKPIQSAAKKFAKLDGNSPIKMSEENKGEVYDAIANEKEFEMSLKEIAADPDLSVAEKKAKASVLSEEFFKQNSTNDAKSVFEAFASLHEAGFEGTNAAFDAKLPNGKRVGDMFGITEKQSDTSKKVIKDARQTLISKGGTHSNAHLDNVEKSAKAAIKKWRSVIEEAVSQIDIKHQQEKALGNLSSTSRLEALENLKSSLTNYQKKITEVTNADGFTSENATSLKVLANDIMSGLAATGTMGDVKGADGGMFNPRQILDTIAVMDGAARQEHPSYKDSTTDKHAGRSAADLLVPATELAMGSPLVLTGLKEGNALRKRKKLESSKKKGKNLTSGITEELASLKGKVGSDASKKAIKDKEDASSLVANSETRRKEKQVIRDAEKEILRRDDILGKSESDIKNLEEDIKDIEFEIDETNKALEGDTLEGEAKATHEEHLETLNNELDVANKDLESLNADHKELSDVQDTNKADLEEKKKNSTKELAESKPKKEEPKKEEEEPEAAAPTNPLPAKQPEAVTKEPKKEEEPEAAAPTNPLPAKQPEAVTKEPKKEKKVTKKAPDAANEDVKNDPDVKKAFDVTDKKADKAADAEIKVDDKQKAYDDKEKEIRGKHESDIRKAEADYEKALASGNEKDIEDTKFAVEDLEQIRVDGLVQNYTVKERHELTMAKDAKSRADQEYDDSYEVYEEAQFEAKAIQDAKNRDDFAKRKAEDDEHNKAIDEEESSVKEEPSEEPEVKKESKPLPTNQPEKPKAKPKAKAENKSKSSPLIPKNLEHDVKTKAEELSTGLYKSYHKMGWDKEKITEEAAISIKNLMGAGLDYKNLTSSDVKADINERIAEQGAETNIKSEKVVEEIIKQPKPTLKEQHDEMVREGVAMGYTDTEIETAMRQEGVTEGVMSPANRVKVLKRANLNAEEGGTVITDDDHGREMISNMFPHASEEQVSEAYTKAKVLPGKKLTDKRVADIANHLNTVVKRDADAAYAHSESQRKEIKSDEAKYDSRMRALIKEENAIAQRKLDKRERRDDKVSAQIIRDKKAKLKEDLRTSDAIAAAYDKDVKEAEKGINGLDNKIQSIQTKIAKLEADKELKEARQSEYGTKNPIHTDLGHQIDRDDAMISHFQEIEKKLSSAKDKAINDLGYRKTGIRSEEVVQEGKVNESIEKDEIDEIMDILNEEGAFDGEDGDIIDVLASKIVNDNKDKPVKERLSSSVKQAKDIVNTYKSERNRKIFDKGVQAAQDANDATLNSTLEELTSIITGLYQKINDFTLAGNVEGKHVAEQALESVKATPAGQRYSEVLEAYHEALASSMARKAEFPDYPEVHLDASEIFKMNEIISKAAGSANYGTWYQKLRVAIHGSTAPVTLFDANRAIQDIESGNRKPNTRDYLDGGNTRPAANFRYEPVHNPAVDTVITKPTQTTKAKKDLAEQQAEAMVNAVGMQGDKSYQNEQGYKDVTVNRNAKGRFLKLSNKKSYPDMIKEGDFRSLKIYDSLTPAQKSQYDADQLIQVADAEAKVKQDEIDRKSTEQAKAKAKQDKKDANAKAIQDAKDAKAAKDAPVTEGALSTKAPVVKEVVPEVVPDTKSVQNKDGDFVDITKGKPGTTNEAGYMRTDNNPNGDPNYKHKGEDGKFVGKKRGNPTGDPQITTKGNFRKQNSKTKEQKAKSETKRQGTLTKAVETQEALDKADNERNLEFRDGKYEIEKASTGVYSPAAITFYRKNMPEKFQRIVNSPNFKGITTDDGHLFDVMTPDSKRKHIQKKDKRMDDNLGGKKRPTGIKRFFENEVKFIEENLKKEFPNGVPHEKRAYQDTEDYSYPDILSDIVKETDLHKAMGQVNDMIEEKYKAMNAPDTLQIPRFELDDFGAPKFVAVKDNTKFKPVAKTIWADNSDKPTNTSKVDDDTAMKKKIERDVVEQLQKDPEFKKKINDEATNSSILQLAKDMNTDFAVRKGIYDADPDLEDRPLRTAEEKWAYNFEYKKNLKNAKAPPTLPKASKKDLLDSVMKEVNKRFSDIKRANAEEGTSKTADEFLSGLTDEVSDQANKVVDAMKGKKGSISDVASNQIKTILAGMGPKTTFNVSDMLEYVIPKLNTSDIDKMVAKRLAKFVPKDLLGSNNGIPKSVGARGLVRTSKLKGIVSFNLAEDMPASEWLPVFLHEAVHAATSGMLFRVEWQKNGKLDSYDANASPADNARANYAPTRKEKELYRDLENQLGDFKKELTRLGIKHKDMYAATNPQEFLAEGLSNPEVQKILKGMKGKKTKNGWTDFVSAISKALGFKNESALTDLFVSFDNISKAQQTTTSPIFGDYKGKFSDTGSGETTTPGSKIGALYEEYSNLKPGDENMEDVNSDLASRGILSIGTRARKPIGEVITSAPRVDKPKKSREEKVKASAERAAKRAERAERDKILDKRLKTSGPKMTPEQIAVRDKQRKERKKAKYALIREANKEFEKSGPRATFVSGGRASGK